MISDSLGNLDFDFAFVPPEVYNSTEFAINNQTRAFFSNYMLFYLVSSDETSLGYKKVPIVNPEVTAPAGGTPYYFTTGYTNSGSNRAVGNNERLV